ncbi:conserved uncharacterized mitochondrial protein [Andalucia godoyi]|uniref:Conserved uncharacterized mitochondrial protein n=1 Tax=Andalucia godoyi TaxID=505711 RepID=A0A8K0AI55_ANDGO|nr:conserved uncharacterized mitochondrial protein [Andalucia godoyi]|eukprot:ANDGO_05660.mRNA.1 conserved uncharacterized mitochondrial protein
MQTIRRKWLLRRTSGRLRALWEDYRSHGVDSESDDAVVLSKFRALVEGFQSIYGELVQSPGSLTVFLERVVVEDTDIVDSVLEFAESERFKKGLNNTEVRDEAAELVSKGLQVVEIMLQDAKFRSVVADSDGLLLRVLSLLDKVHVHAAQVTALNVMIELVVSEMNRAFVLEHDGIGKLIRLFGDGNEAVKKQVLKAISHCMNASISQSHVERELSRLSTADPSAANGFPSAFRQDAQNESFHHPTSDAGTGDEEPSKSVHLRRIQRSAHRRTVSDKVTGLVVDMSKLLGSELVRLFPSMSFADNLSDEAEVAQKHNAHAISGMLDGNQHVEPEDGRDVVRRTLAAARGAPTIGQKVFVFPPSSDEIQDELGKVMDLLSAVANASPIFGDALPVVDAKDDVLGIRGALSSLTELVKSSALSVQLDLIRTVSRIVLGNKRNQDEMRRIDGYSFFLNLFDFVQEFSSVDAQSFLRDAFDVLFVVVLDDHKDMRVGNHDALRTLFRLLTSSKVPEVQMHTLRCLHDIMAVNMWNVLDVRQCGGIECLVEFVFSIPCACNGEGVQPSRLHTQLLDSSLELLVYVGVVLQKSELRVLELLATAVCTRHAELPPQCMFACLRSCVALVSDVMFRLESVPTVHAWKYLVPLLEYLLASPLLDSHSVLVLLDLLALASSSYDSAVLFVDAGLLGLILPFLSNVSSTPQNVFERCLSLFSVMTFVCSSHSPNSGVEPSLHIDLLSNFEVKQRLSGFALQIVDGLLSVIRGCASSGSLDNVKKILGLARLCFIIFSVTSFSDAMLYFLYQRGLASLVDLIELSPSAGLDVLLCIGEAVRGSNFGKQYFIEIIGLEKFDRVLRQLYAVHQLQFLHCLILLELFSFASIMDVVVPLADASALALWPNYSPSFSVVPAFDGPWAFSRDVSDPTVSQKFSRAGSVDAVHNFAHPHGFKKPDIKSMKSSSLSVVMNEISDPHSFPASSEWKHVPTHSAPTSVRPSRSSLSLVPDDGGDGGDSSSLNAHRDSVSSHSGNIFTTPGGLFEFLENMTSTSSNAFASMLDHNMPYSFGPHDQESFLSGLNVAVDLRRRGKALLFRDPDCVSFMMTQLWTGCSDDSARADMLRVVLSLLDLHPRNRQMFVSSGAFIWFLDAAASCFDIACRTLCFQIASCIGRHSMRAGELEHLLKQIENTSKLQEANVALQTALLSVMGRISERDSPSSFFSFDGITAGVSAGSVKSMPASKSGISVSLMFRLGVFPLVEAMSHHSPIGPACCHDARSVLCCLVDSSSMSTVEIGLRLLPSPSVAGSSGTLSVSSSTSSFATGMPHHSGLTSSRQSFCHIYLRVIGKTGVVEEDLNFEACRLNLYSGEWVRLSVSVGKGSVQVDLSTSRISSASLSSSLPMAFYPKNTSRDRPMHVMLGRRPQMLVSDWGLPSDLFSVSPFRYWSRTTRALRSQDDCRKNARVLHSFCGQISEFDIVDKTSQVSLLPKEYQDSYVLLTALESEQFDEQKVPIAIRSSHAVWIVIDEGKASEIQTEGVDDINSVLLFTAGDSEEPKNVGSIGAPAPVSASTSLTPKKKSVSSTSSALRLRQRVSILDGATFHATHLMTEFIADCGGLQRLFQFLKLPSGARLSSLKVFASLISHSSAMKEEFLRSRAPAAITHALISAKRIHEEISAEVVDTIVLIAKKAQSPDGWHMAMDLLPEYNLDVLRHFLRRLLDSFLEGKTNNVQSGTLENFRRGPGLMELLNFWLFKSQPDVFPLLSVVVSQMLRDTRLSEVQASWAFLSSMCSAPATDATWVPAICSFAKTLKELIQENAQFAEASGSIPSDDSPFQPVNITASLEATAASTSASSTSAVSAAEVFPSPVAPFSSSSDVCSFALAALFGLLDSVHESVRYEGLCMLTVLLKRSSRCRMHFFKSNVGYEKIESILIRHPASALTFDAMFAFAREQIDSTAVNNAAAATSQFLVRQPEVLRIIFMLLHFACEDSQLHMKVLDIVDRLVEEDGNAEQLIEYNWFERCWKTFLPLAFSQTSTFTNDFRVVVDRITRRLLWFDLCRQPRVSKITRIKDMVDASDVQLSLLRCVIDVLFEFEDSEDPSKKMPAQQPTSTPKKKVVGAVNVGTPTSPSSSTQGLNVPGEKLQHIIRNLSALLDSLDADILLTPHVCLRILLAINQLAYRSSFEMRTRMKNANLFVMRDHFTTLCLMLLQPRIIPKSGQDESVSENESLPVRSLSVAEIMDILTQFPFESVAEQQSFRDTGLLCLLRLLFRAEDVPSSRADLLTMQSFIFDVVVHVFLQVEDNRKVIAKVVGDETVFSRLDSSEEFTEWYGSSEQVSHRQLVEMNVSKSWAIVEDSYLKNREKLQAKRLKKLKVRQEEKQKNRSLSARSISELDARCALLLSSLREWHVAHVQDIQERKTKRLDAGLSVFPL